MADFMVPNAAYPTTAAMATTATGTAIKTLTQVTASANTGLKVWRYSVSFDGTGTTPIKVELLTTGTVAGGTPTAITPSPFSSDSFGAVSTATAGFAPATEGTITTTRPGDVPQQILPGNYFVYEFSLGREFYVPPGNVVRVRVTASASVGAYAGLFWTE